MVKGSIDSPYGNDLKRRFDSIPLGPYLSVVRRTMCRFSIAGGFMETRHRIDRLDHRPAIGRNDLLIGVWLRSAFAGAAVAAAGVVSLFDPSQGLSVLTALTWIAAGATFAWLAWQRAAARLDGPDDDAPTAPDSTRIVRNRPAARAQASS
jgi:hypothetical protein